MPGTVLSIQILRGLAAMLVVLYHAALLQGDTLAAFPYGAGRFGVDVFFVISAFVMILTTEGRHVTPLGFLLRRLARIAPLYYLATLLAALLAVALPGFLIGTLFTPGHFTLSLLFIPHPNPANPEAIAPLYRLGWTLNFEMYFYSCLALALLVARQHRILIVSAIVVGLVTATNAGLVTATPLAFLGANIALEFVFGMILARLWLDGRLPVFPPALALTLLAAALAAPFLMEALGITRPRGVLFGAAAVLCVMAALSLEPLIDRTRHRLLLAVGDASYSLYLSHVFLIAALVALWSGVGLPAMTIATGLAFVVLCLILAPLLAWQIYLWVERPMIAFFKKHPKRASA